MFRVVIPAILAVALTACGGGGGGGGSPANPAQPDSVEAPLYGATYSSRFAPMVLAHFTDAQTQHMVMGHHQYLGGGRTAPAPVRVYQLNSDGTMADVTVAILGGAVTVSTNTPLVADFNHDGIDDLFLPGFSDSQDMLPSVAFISRRGMSHIRVDLPDLVWAHGATAIDANDDGHLDVMSSWGEIWFNDGQGNFRFQPHDGGSAPGFWIHGSGVCAGDFNGSGKSQVVLTDQMIDAHGGPLADTVIFELGPTGLPVAQHYLPVPYYDRNNVSTTELSHDVTCKVVDVNNDGLQDILVFSRPAAVGATGRWTNEGMVQVLINRGHWQFDDVTDTVMGAYKQGGLLSYNPLTVDLNGDGKVDVWASSYDFGTGNSNQALLSSVSGPFNQSLESVLAGFQATGGMLPVKFGDKWAFIIARMGLYESTLYFTKPVYTFN